MPCLIIETDELNKEPCMITLGNEAVIGREKSNNIYINDERASRRHAKITKEPDGSFLLVDMGSRNGMIVNGEKVSRRKLIDKDRIVIGRTTLVYNESASVSAQTPVQPAASAETLKMTADDPSRLGGTSDKTITADPLGRPVGEPAKLGSDALKKAIQEVTSPHTENKAATGAKKAVYAGSPNAFGAAPAGSGITKNTPAAKTAVSGGEVADEGPSLGKRIMVFLVFLIFFVTILLFAKEITKRLLSKAEKSPQTKNIPSSEKPKGK